MVGEELGGLLMRREYEIQLADGLKLWRRMDDAEWFDLFRAGFLDYRSIRWMQPKDDESKRVTFAENLPDATPLS